MSTNQVVKYRLATTVVKLDGSVSIDTGDDGRLRYTRTCQVTIGCEADSAADLTVEIDDSFDEKRKFDIKLADDGRLTGATDTTTGLGAQVIGSVVTVGAAAAKVAAGLTLFLARPAPDNDQKGAPATLEQQYHTAHSDSATRRSDLTSAVTDLDAALVKLTKAIAASDSVTPEDQAKLTAVVNALAGLRTELAAAETEFQTWKTATFPTQKINVSVAIGAGDLPRVDAAPAVRQFSDLTGQADSAALLGIAVAIVEPDSVLENEPVVENTADAKLYYRRPRQAQIVVYSLPEEPEEDQTMEVDLKRRDLQLNQLAPVWIIDKHSDIGCVELTHGLLRSRTTTIAFSDSGTLSEIGNQESPPLDALTTALGAAGGQVTSTLDDVSKISAAFQPSDPTDALASQVKEKELQARLIAANAAIAKATAGVKAPA